MDINIVVLYIMCFSIVIFFGLTIHRHKSEGDEDFNYIMKKIVKLNHDIARLEKLLKNK